MTFEQKHGALLAFTVNKIATSNLQKRSNSKSMRNGSVSLVGAGPGDPDLLTIKALRTIQTADLIIFDSLVSDEIRNLFPKGTPTQYVGKRKNQPSIKQTDINTLLIESAKSGLNVCRLKGGDAFIFGRGSEEMLELKNAEIKVEVVPGITAASGCSSYAGIPLTHRGLSQGCTFVTGHAESKLGVNWQALAQLDHTLIFYMGLSKASLIEENLMAGGLDKNTPVAFIENGCKPEQRIISGTLQQLSQLVTSHNIQSPALIMIGKVVALSEQLQWLERSENTDHFIKQLSA